MEEYNEIGKNVINEKKHNWSKISRNVFLVNLILALFFFLIFSMLMPEELELRTWVIQLGYIGILFPLPITLTVFVLSTIQRKHKADDTKVFGNALGKGVLLIVGAIYLVVSIFLFELAEEEYLQKESYLASGVIEGIDKNSNPLWVKIANGKLFDKDSTIEYKFYHPNTPFFKKRYRDEQQIVLLKMQQIYQESFQILGEEILNGYHYFSVESNDNPHYVFQTGGMEGNNAFKNDYPAIRANEIIRKTVQALCPDVNMEISTELIDGKQYTNGMLMFHQEGNDNQFNTEDIAAIIGRVLEDEFFLFPGNFSQITVDCGTVEDRKFQFVLQVGNTDLNHTLTKPDLSFAIADNIDTLLQNCYEEKMLYQKEIEEQQNINEVLERQTEEQQNINEVLERQTEEQQNINEVLERQIEEHKNIIMILERQIEEHKKIIKELERQTEKKQDVEEPKKEPVSDYGEENPEYDMESLETPEGAYRQLYQEIFEKEGYPYDCRYNAKGNFYGMLSEDRGKPSEDAPEMDRVRTVVYDRVSKNEKCHTFVYYESYYTDEGAEYTTKFLDFYAVDMVTGKVFAGDKHGWGDVPNAEYRKATGE